MNSGNLEFISLEDFLTLPFINPYSKCIVYDLDTEDTLISERRIKELIAAIKAGKYEELQDNYYVSDLMPGIGIDCDKTICGRYYIYLKRF